MRANRIPGIKIFSKYGVPTGKTFNILRYVIQPVKRKTNVRRSEIIGNLNYFSTILFLYEQESRFFLKTNDSFNLKNADIVQKFI